MKIAPVLCGSFGIDCATVLTAESAAGLKGTPIDFVARYLGQLTPPELAIILEAGLGVELVTFSHAPGWEPSAALGNDEGHVDVARLAELGIPTGMVVWIDLEGSGGDAAATAAWVNARATVLVEAGYVAGLYVGAGCVLDGAELYALPHVTRYWRAFNEGIPEPACGFCQFQLFPPDQTLAGVLVDLDFTQEDYARRTPMMLVAEKEA